MKYDLEERTAKFAESVITILKNIKVSPLNSRIVEQLKSKKDFYHKIQIAKTAHKLRQLWSEAHELLLIFSKILSSRKT